MPATARARPGLDGRPAAQLLQVEHGHELEPDASARRAPPRRCWRAPAPRSAGCRAASAARATGARRPRTRRAAPPPPRAWPPCGRRDVGRVHDREHQQQHRGGQRDRARRDRGAPAGRSPGPRAGAARIAATSRSAASSTGAKNTQRQPSAVNSPPTTMPEREPARADAGVDEHRPVCAARPAANSRHDDRQPGRGEEGRGDARREPGEDQHPRLGGDPAEAGEGEEHHQPADEHASPPEQVGRPAAEQHEPAVAEHVAADHPLQRCGVRPSSARIEGSATPIIETSIPSRKIAPHSTNSTAHRRMRRSWAATIADTASPT